MDDPDDKLAELVNQSRRTQAPRRRETKKVQTIEATAKRWKLMQLLGVLAIMLGVALMFNEPTRLAAVLLVLIGVPMWVFGRVAAWWFHG
jgi:uncharacterized membrane protein HdeD (DUF308 family)